MCCGRIDIGMGPVAGGKFGKELRAGRLDAVKSGVSNTNGVYWCDFGSSSAQDYKLSVSEKLAGAHMATFRWHLHLAP